MKSFVRQNFSSLQGPVRTLAVLHFVDSLGGGLFVAGSAVYFVLVARIPAAEVGLGLSLAGFTGFLSSVILGRIADRVGARRLLLLLLLTLAGSYAVYPAVRSPWAFFVVVALAGALEFGCNPAFSALLMDLVPEEDRVPTRAALRSLFNIGFSGGALLSATFIGAGGTALQLLPLGNALSFALCAVLVLRLPGSAARPNAAGGGRLRALRDLPFLSVVGASTLLALHSAVLLVGIPLWIVRKSGLPHSAVPLVLVLNTVLVVLFQIRAARGARTLDGATSAGRRAGLVSCAACAVMAVAGLTGVWLTGAIALAAVLLFTLAELWQSASGFGLSFGLAPDSARAEYLGAFALHVVVQATVGPALVAFLVIGYGPAGWLAMGLIFLTGAAAIGPAVGWARRNPSGTAVASSVPSAAATAVTSSSLSASAS
jgi:MFS family permease